jgi:hypothetical protein
VKRIRSGVAAAAVAAIGVLGGPLAGSAFAGSEPTKLVAHSIVADVQLPNTQARVPIRPSATLYDKSTGKPLAGQVIQFFAAGKGLCAVRTNSLGYAECPGLIRILFPTLALGGYQAVYPGDSTYHRSTDKGQLVNLAGQDILP